MGVIPEGPGVDALTLPHMAHGTAICVADRLNVRAEPNTTSAVQGQLIKGQQITVWALDQRWMIVQAEGGLTGWAAANYCQVVGELEA